MAHIAFTTEDGEEFSHEFPEGTTHVGRGEKNEYTIPEGSLSGVHAKFILENGDFSLEDLNSTNGSKVNGMRINELTLLENGDAVTLGRVQGVVTHGATQASKPPQLNEEPLTPEDFVEENAPIGDGDQEMPALATGRVSIKASDLGESSEVPETFEDVSVSAFGEKVKVKDPSATGVLTLGGIGLLAIVASIVFVLLQLG